MRRLKRVCAGVVLMLALSVPTFAGQTPCDGIAEPPPPPAETTTEDTSAGVVEALATFLLSLF
jgi:hypothetical protein